MSNISDTICWLPISEYFNDNVVYDWVLVKMLDGSNECIPTVAEYNRSDGTWHKNDSEYTVLPFPVVAFADMELIKSPLSLQKFSEEDEYSSLFYKPHEILDYVTTYIKNKANLVATEVENMEFMTDSDNAIYHENLGRLSALEDLKLIIDIFNAGK